jgi:predicted transposase YbfD/YdcC
VIDGKALRGTHEKKTSSMLKTLNAWGRETGLILGQMAIEEGSNEYSTLPDFLKVLQLKGCLVTLDAVACQKNIVDEIVEQEADYIITLKKNQPLMYSQVENFFQEQAEIDFADLASFSTEEKGHGRIERRFYWMTDQIDWLEGREQWEKLHSIGFVLSEREVKKKVTTEVRFFLSSLSCNVEYFARSVRGHWEIENKLHWVLDVVFREDDSRIRSGYGAENLVLLRKIALNLLRQDDDKYKSIKGRRKMAGWSTDYLLKLLNLL